MAEDLKDLEFELVLDLADPERDRKPGLRLLDPTDALELFDGVLDFDMASRGRYPDLERAEAKEENYERLLERPRS